MRLMAGAQQRFCLWIIRVKLGFITGKVVLLKLSAFRRSGGCLQRAMESGSCLDLVTLPLLPCYPPSTANLIRLKGTPMTRLLFHHHQQNFRESLPGQMTTVVKFGLNIQPDKCYSLLYDGKVATRLSNISVGGKTTTNIVEKPTTFLGSIVTGWSHSRKGWRTLPSLQLLPLTYSTLTMLQ